ARATRRDLHAGRPHHLRSRRLDVPALPDAGETAKGGAGALQLVGARRLHERLLARSPADVAAAADGDAGRLRDRVLRGGAAADQEMGSSVIVSFRAA